MFTRNLHIIFSPDYRIYLILGFIGFVSEFLFSSGKA